MLILNKVLINVHLLVNKLYEYQNAWCNDKGQFQFQSYHIVDYVISSFLAPLLQIFTSHTFRIVWYLLCFPPHKTLQVIMSIL